MTAPCSVNWCGMLAAAGSEFCTVHRDHPLVRDKYAYDSIAINPDECPDCEGTGQCYDCDGDGESDCKCSECGDWHTSHCETCDSSGDCPTCKFSREARDKMAAETTGGTA